MIVTVTVTARVTPINGKGDGKDLEPQVPPVLCAPRVSGCGMYQSKIVQDEQSNSKQDASFVRGSLEIFGSADQQ